MPLEKGPMSKRFTETGKWDDPWYASLPFKHKLAWEYMLSKCDNAGVWSPNFALADFQIGTKIDWDEFLKSLGAKVRVIRSDKWWIPAFIRFQYGRLSDQARVHLSVLRLLESHGLLSAYNQWVSDGIAMGSGSHPDGIAIPQEQRQEKEQGQEQDTAGRSLPPSVPDVSAYGREIGFAIDAQKFCDFYASKGWMIGKNKMKDWRACVRTWKSQDNSAPFRQPDAQRIPDNLKGLDLTKVGL